MTKLKDNISAEEHKKFEEEQKRPFRMEIADVGNDTFSIKSPILLPKKQYELVQKICDIIGEHIQEYIKDAFFMKVQTDLENPSCFGQMVCENLRRQWDLVKPK